LDSILGFPMMCWFGTSTLCTANSTQSITAQAKGIDIALPTVAATRFANPYSTGDLLPLNKMQEAATHFLGEHDFAGFTKLNHGRKTTVRRVDQCTVQETDPWRISMDVAGTGFLWNMVRIIAGTLLEVGRGYISPSDVPDIIASCDRKRAGKTMSAQGLSLEWVKYDLDQ
jgi:tRNA pseudouridine38-40 synthase